MRTLAQRQVDRGEWPSVQLLATLIALATKGDAHAQCALETYCTVPELRVKENL